MTVVKHLHKLKRHTHATGSQIYFCVNDCSYRVQVELSLGKIVECWRCGNSFKMNTYSMTLAKPHCEACHKDKHNKNTQRPLTKVANVAGDNIVDGLAERLKSLTFIPTGTIKELKSNAAEIREFKLEEDEDLI